MALLEQSKKRKRINGGRPKIKSRALIMSKTAASRNSSIKDVPDAILMDIFIRLPLISIMHLCPFFPHVLSRPKFESLYRRSHPSALFMGYNTKTKQEEIIEYYQDVHRIVSTKLNLIDFFREVENPSTCFSFDIVGCCNGLLLGRATHMRDAGGTTTTTTESLRLVNPITGRSVKFAYTEEPTRRPTRGVCFSTKYEYGLGYSSKTGLYKVVHLDLDFDLDFEPGNGNSIKIFTVELSTNNSCCRSCSVTYYNDPLICKELSALVPYLGSPLALNNAIYWLVLGTKNMILRFDIDKETFEFIPLPYEQGSTNNHLYSQLMNALDGSTNNNHLYSQLSALGGSLCVLETNPSIDRRCFEDPIDQGCFVEDPIDQRCFEDPIDRRCFEVWVMKESGGKDYNWTQLTTINLQDNGGNGCLPPLFELVNVLDNGKLLIKSGAQLRLYDPIHKEWDDTKKPLAVKEVITMSSNFITTNFFPNFSSLPHAF